LPENYCYKAYSLNISSSIALPELPFGEGPPDISIRDGAVPTRLADAGKIGICYQVGPNRVLITIDGLGRFLISGGDEVLVERDPSVEEGVLRVFLLGPVLGALLHQRGLLVLHGSAIVVDEGCVALLGVTGSGKSTVAAAFRNLGYRIMADDILAVSTSGGRFTVYPGYPALALWSDVIRKLGKAPDSLERVRPELEKYRLPLGEGFYAKPLPLYRLYVLTFGHRGKPRLIGLKPPANLNRLKRHIYHLEFREGLGTTGCCFKQCKAVADHVPVSLAIYPRRPFLLDESVYLLEEDFLL